MSLVTLVPTALGGAQAAAASVATVKNILAGLTPRLSSLSALELLNRDLGGFQFDYMGERRLEAGVEITDHYTESNQFMQDHAAVKPTRIIMRGYVAETTYNRSKGLPALLALSTALTPITPYLGRYAPGAAAKMQAAVTQTDQIINQLAQIQGLYGSITKLVSSVPQKTKVQAAYDKLDALRTGGATFVVVTPWATFGDIPSNGHGPMMIENLVMTEPDDTKSWNDIIVLLKEIRVAPSFLTTTLDNSRGSQQPAINGSIGATTA